MTHQRLDIVDELRNEAIFDPIRQKAADEIERLRTWKPIETAPRDGTPFLCFHPDDVFSPQTGIDLIWYEPSIKTYTMDGDTEVPFAGITHWMPLPTPPSRT